jgi:D-alanyl-D-alanine carboxypeptidase
MNSGANRSFDRNKSKSLALSNNSRLCLAIRTAISFRACFFFLVVTFVSLVQMVVVAATEVSNSGGLVDIGGGRKIYLKCRGTGSPTVVLISGTRGAHDDWTDLIDPKNPVGATKPGESAVFPQVSKFTQVCAYDRPGTTRNDNTVTASTPVRQPTTAQQGVADLHVLLIAAREPGPYILVGHSWGGLIARLFASTYPDQVSGLVLVDPASEFLKSSLTPTQWATYIEATKKLMEPNGLEAPDHARTLELLHDTPQVRPMPVVVLTSDKRFDFGAGGAETWPAWRTAQDRLAKILNAKHVSNTNSSHVIQMEQPQRVVDAIWQVVEAVRSGSHQVARNETDTELLPIAESSRIPLEKALDEAFTKSGLPGVITGLWIPGTGSWIASRGVADLKTKAPMTANLQAPIGSITKSFAVTIALQLVGEGKLRLEDTIERWYPQIPEASAITIKMLLNHSSGFADISMLQLDLHCADPKRLVSPDELIAMSTKLPRAQFPPGKGSLYSSLNTIVLGRILEKITGESFDALLSECLLKPLALRRTKLDTDGKLDPPFCHGYTDFCRNMPRHTDTSEWPQFSFAAGALASTLSDLHKWGIALGEGFGLTPELRRARIDEELGIAIQRERPGGRVISFGHSGSEAGYSANVQYYPCTGTVWALMANGDAGTGEAFIPVLKALQPIVEPLVVPSEKCATVK